MKTEKPTTQLNEPLADLPIAAEQTTAIKGGSIQLHSNTFQGGVRVPSQSAGRRGAADDVVVDGKIITGY